MNQTFLGETKRRKGFTLPELMIVLAIVAILVGLAYPAYGRFAKKARRGDVQEQLLDWAVRLEAWRATNTSFADGGAPGATAPTNDHYTFSTTTLSATDFVLQAVANGGGAQIGDKERGKNCETLTYARSGVKGAEKACWSETGT